MVHVLKGNAPHVEVSMLVDSHMTAGIPLAAGSHHKGFSDPSFLENKTKSISAKTAWVQSLNIYTVLFRRNQYFKL